MPAGRYTVTARLTCEGGSATAPVTLRRPVRVCAAVAPAFTA